LLGVPWQVGNERTYLLGQLPVAVAFFVWADTTELRTQSGASSGAPAPAWWAWVVVPILPAGAVWLVFLLGVRRRRRSLAANQGTA